MKMIGVFEAKTKFSKICDEVARSGRSVLVTKRGHPLVRIDPLPSYTTAKSQVWEAREQFDPSELPERDFTAPSRPEDPVDSPFAAEDES
jgi:prevent-host-death family protein